MSDNPSYQAKYLRAIVDIGSNGIRFSISSIAAKQARIFPCLFQDRAAISLFDAVHSETASEVGIGSSSNHNNSSSGSSTKNISPETTADVISSLLRFQTICHDFGVLDENVHIVATEATREASNSVEFRQALKEATGWEVHLLSKVDEARTGAHGVASSFCRVRGLFMDIGGGSVQISWINCLNGVLQMSDKPVSVRYGAAALTRRMSRESTASLEQEIKSQLKAAIETIEIPQDFFDVDLANTGGLKLYVCGGGFRGLGNLLLATHDISPYPLPIINGFHCTKADISALVADKVEEFKAKSNPNNMYKSGAVSKKIFRISERRAIQMPAVSLLVSCALEVFPPVRKVLFSQGGVREGLLYQQLPEHIRSQDPLLVATSPYAPLLASRYVEVLRGGIPTARSLVGGGTPSTGPFATAPPVISERIVAAVVNVAFAHSSYPKELQPSAALSIACTGLISGCHGLSHQVRALLGLALCQRWGGELPYKTLKDQLIQTLQPKTLAWWALYVGCLMHVVGGVYPGGNVHSNLLTLRVSDVSNTSFTLHIEIVKDVKTCAPTVKSRISGLEKKLRKISKDVGKQNSYKVAVVVNYKEPTRIES